MDVVTLKERKSLVAKVNVLSNVGMFGVVEIFGHKSAWARTCALVVAREPFAREYNPQCPKLTSFDHRYPLITLVTRVLFDADILSFEFGRVSL